MATKPIPDGYHTITPYLVVQDAGALIEFAVKAFSAEEKERMTMPNGKIMHAEIRIGDSFIMMGETSERWPAMPTGLYVYVDDVDATYKRALEAGATSVMEPADQFYGDRNGGVKDPSGNLWWIAKHIEDVSPEELKKRAAALPKPQS